MLACQTNLSTGHHITERLKNFYSDRARGGVGLIVIGFIFLFRYPEDENTLCLDDDSLIPEYRSLTEIIHNNEAKVIAQLGIEHLWKKGPDYPLEAVGPSNVTVSRHYPVVKPLQVEEIQQAENAIVAGIVRARKANFDGVEIQAAQGLLLSQSLSPYTNRRTDQYSVSSPENRTRILAEILEKARKAAGPDFTLTCKISGDDFIEGGNTIEETPQIAAMLEKMGFQGINVAAGWHNSPVPITVSMVPEGSFSYLSEKIKKTVHIPVITSYRITSPQVAEDILAKGKADLVGLARALIADPEWPNKARQGSFEDIRPCIVCCRCLDQSFTGKEGVYCSVNPAAGREGEIYPRTKVKKVMVIGAGPAGIQASLAARGRGHDVSLVESRDFTGGQLNLAFLPPYKDDIAKLVKFYEHQLEKSDIKVSLNTEATPDMIAKAKVDSVIVATGSSPLIPDLPGVRDEGVMSALDIISGKKETGDRVVIVGGGMIGCETAEMLAGKGKKVIVLEMLDRIANDVGPSNRWVLLMRLKKAGIRLESKARVVEIREGEVVVQRDGRAEAFEGDTIVIAVGMKPDNNLARELRGLVPDVNIIGDASSPRRIKEAVEEGYLAGIRL